MAVFNSKVVSRGDDGNDSSSDDSSLILPATRNPNTDILTSSRRSRSSLARQASQAAFVRTLKADYQRRHRFLSFHVSHV